MMAHDRLQVHPEGMMGPISGDRLLRAIDALPTQAPRQLGLCTLALCALAYAQANLNRAERVGPKAFSSNIALNSMFHVEHEPLALRPGGRSRGEVEQPPFSSMELRYPGAEVIPICAPSQ